MARNPARGDLVRRIARMEEQLRQLRTRRPVFDLPYIFTAADFVGQTISGTYYGWSTTEFGSRPLRLHRYGGLLSLTGTFKRLWTADGSTPGGYSPGLNAIISSPALPDELFPVAENGFRVPIHHDNNSSQSDLATVYTGDLEPAGSDFLNIVLEHVDYTIVGSAPQVPKRRTVYFYVDITVPFTPPPS